MPAGEAMDGDRGTRTAASQPIIHYHRHNLKNRFELIKTLGEGTYGKVKLAIELDTGEKVAIKYIRKKKIQDDQDLNRIRREIKVMAKLRHPHIINVREVFENREKIVLVMDYASGGELYDYINSKKRLDDRDARRIFRQIVSAVHYCHENGVVHRDLKLENIVLDDNGNVRIADFGLSNFYGGNDLLTTYCGSPLYASPEIVNGQPYHGPEVDCWSLGVLLYTLVYGAMPFDGTDFKTLKKQISAGDYYEPSQLSDAANLIRQMLNPNPSKRATMEKICNYWWLNIGYSITPAGSVYPLPCQQTTLPSFSFLNFLSNGEGNVRGYGAKYSRSVGGKSDQPFTCKISLDVGVRSQTDLRSDDSDTLSEHSNEDTKKLFDAEKRPSRSILKKPGKFRGSDSGCGLEDTASPSCQDLNSPICDLHSQSDKYSASRPSANEVPDRFVSSKLNIELYSKQDSETKDHKFDSTRPYSGQNVPKEDSPALRCSCKISPCAKCVKESPEMLNLTEDSFTRVQRNASPSSLSEESKPPRRGILKRPKKTVLTAEEQRKRNSMGSQGSNSSADLLDFSYDSTEGEQLLSRYCSSNETSRTSSSCGSPVTLDKTTTCQMRFQSMSLSEEDLFSKSKAFDEPLFDIGEARDICRQALEICSIKGL